MKKLVAFFILILLYGCFSYDRKWEVFKTDKDFVEFWRLPSPDSSMVLLNYGIDQGAFGYGHAGTAILRLNDTLNNLRLFTLSNSYDRLTWLDNKTISAKFDTIPYVRSGEHPNFKDTAVNGVKVKVSSYDYIEPNSEREIEHRDTSPDGKYELVAYRYINDVHNLNFIHVSVIPTGGRIPKYGNYLIADVHSDYVLNGKWDNDNTLIFYSNNLYSDMVQYYLVHNRPDIKYKVVNDDKNYSSKYLWIKQSSK
ncbi:MAG: hypothetical protein J7502_04985 [Flavisolibacter sp.]|nr:hypothetical protein [Flavisolibacter sp.]